MANRCIEAGGDVGGIDKKSGMEIEPLNIKLSNFSMSKIWADKLIQHCNCALFLHLP